MAIGHSNDDAADGAQAREDRLWILVSARSGESYLEQLFCGGPRPTLVLRDGEHVLFSVDVGPRSSVAEPYRIDDPDCSDATLVVRLVSATAPCVSCVDESLASADDVGGGLDASVIFKALRAGLARCTACPHSTPSDAHPIGGNTSSLTHGSTPPESAGHRSSGALRLVPPNAPQVPAGGTPVFDDDVDVILIV